jgi:hypothetical protein
VYNDLGRLAARTYGDEVCREVSTYDIQGRLRTQSNPHFAMTLRYDNPLHN